MCKGFVSLRLIISASCVIICIYNTNVASRKSQHSLLDESKRTEKGSLIKLQYWLACYGYKGLIVRDKAPVLNPKKKA